MPSKPSVIQLNLGCGENKLEGFTNIDVEKSTKPDMLLNFISKPLPYKTGTVTRVVLFHTIEHICKRFHSKVLLEIHRVLKPTGRLIITYPEFTRCFARWESNANGLKDFWEKTLFGRQLFSSDFHVCIMHTPDFKLKLEECGFNAVKSSPEATQPHNTVITCTKGVPYKNYETLCLEGMEPVKNDKKPSKSKYSRKSR